MCFSSSPESVSNAAASFVCVQSHDTPSTSQADPAHALGGIERGCHARQVPNTAHRLSGVPATGIVLTLQVQYLLLQQIQRPARLEYFVLHTRQLALQGLIRTAIANDRSEKERREANLLQTIQLAPLVLLQRG